MKYIFIYNCVTLTLWDRKDTYIVEESSKIVRGGSIESKEEKYRLGCIYIYT